MMIDLIGIALMLPLLYFAWTQQKRIEDLEIMVGYTLSLIAEEDDDVVSDHKA